MRQYCLYLVCVLCAFGSQNAFCEEPNEGCMNAAEPMAASVDPCYCRLPLTAELRICTDKSDSYNIFIANQTKSSPWHWEIFSMPSSGTLSAYIPGFVPNHLHSQVKVTDGQWHHIVLSLQEKELSLSLDGKVVASAIPEKTPMGQESENYTGLYLGTLSDDSLQCEGWIDDVKIWNGSKVAAAWDFSVINDKGGKDISGNNRDLRLKSNFYIPMPPLEDPASWRQSVQEWCRRLELKTEGLGQERGAVYSFWKFNLDNYGKINYASARHAEWFATDQKAQERVARQAFDPEVNIQPEDRGAAGTVLRQTGDLLNLLETMPNVDLLHLKTAKEDWGKLKKVWEDGVTSETADGIYFTACAVRRQVMFLNPLLDFDDFLCVTRGSYQGSVRSQPSTSDGAGGHFACQYFGYTTLSGGGLYRIKNWRSIPQIENIVEHSVVQNGRLAGKKLDHGAFCSPDLSYDGKKILFSWSENRSHKLNAFTPDRVWHVFRVDSDGENLVQLTDGNTDDFDACWLPNGRIVFVSERRGGYIRCFDRYIQVPNYTMFSMEEDGSDIVPISYFETSEWNPSVNHDGMLVYSRWDYTDRENCIGGRFWICGPDGTNPRAPHGNYPDPYHSFPGNQEEFLQKYDGEIPYTGIGSRWGAPIVEMGIRAIPGSHRYVMTAAPHHGQLNGSLAILDLRVKDDNYVSQVKRLTPDELFPETEYPARGHYKYGTPWPLSEDFFLSNCWEDIILLDRFGNQEILCGIREINPLIDERFRMLDPIPMVPRPTPPIVPTRTYQGKRADIKDRPLATISVMNVYDTDLPLPKDVKIKYLRVVQNILKENHAMGEPMAGYERENTPRIPLGIVPVEEDGSVYFEAPVAKELIYQLLDENKTAVHSMRSVSFVFPGEQLSCVGCHEPNDRPPVAKGVPMAMRKAPSKLQPEMDPIEPISYYRQIKPIFEQTCLPCHRETGKGLQDMSYEAVKEDTFWFSGGMFGTTVGNYPGIHGGSRTIPGRFGARSCRIGKTLLGQAHQKWVSEKERQMILLWLDCNSLRLGSFMHEDEQLKGKLVWPSLDVDPANVQGIDGSEPALKKNFWHENQNN